MTDARNSRLSGLRARLSLALEQQVNPRLERVKRWSLELREKLAPEQSSAEGLPQRLVELAREVRGSHLSEAAGLMTELLSRSLPTTQTVATLLPSLLRHRDPQVLLYFQASLAAVLAQEPELGPHFARTLSDQLERVPPENHRRFMVRVLRGAYVDPNLSLVLAEHLPTLLEGLQDEALDAFMQAGFSMWRERPDKATSFFRLESRHANAEVESLRQSLALSSVRRTLQLYAQAHGGPQVRVRGLDELPEKHRSDALSPSRGGQQLSAFTDGRTIYLPTSATSFGNQEDNFRLYKAMTAIEAGRIEFGTFRLTSLPHEGLSPITSPDGRDQEGLQGARRLRERIERLPSPELSRALFGLLETHRVEQRVRLEYPGLKGDLERLTRDGLSARPSPAELERFPALLEALSWRLWGRPLPDELLPPSLREPLHALLPLAESLAKREATVEDSLEQTERALRALQQLRWVPQNPTEPERPPHEDSTPDAPDPTGAQAPPSQEELPGGQASAPGGPARTSDAGERQGRPGASTQDAPLYEPLPHHGQLWLELAEELQDEAARALEEASSTLQRDLNTPAKPEEGGPAWAEGAGEAAADVEGESGTMLREARPTETSRVPSPKQMAEGVSQLFYPEWDCHIDDYKDRWCQVVEERLPEHSAAFAQETLATHGALIKQLRRQFQRIRREEFVKLRRRLEGDEVDIEAAVEAIIERKGHRPPDERLYIQRQKQARDVAVAFLVDMSSSTQQVIHANGRSILDTEKESLLLMAEALESLGDAYAIYGFSGYGRSRVSFYVAKDFQDPYGELVQRRISGMSGRLENRDGAAIRHAVSKLVAWPARVRLLILLSDGRPLDCGCRQYFERYAQEDTRMALREAQRQQVHPFCITVDRQAQRYLSHMYSQVQFTIIDQVAALPFRLPGIYRRLTT